VFLVELLPEGGTLKKGFTEGAASALAARKKAASKGKPKKTAKPKVRASKPVKARADNFAAVAAAG
jgi:hypothetical protein